MRERTRTGRKRTRIRAFFEVSSLDPESESVTEEGVLDVAATVTNTGESEGTQEIELRAGGETLDSRELTLDADESDTVSFEGIDAADLGPGEYTHGLHSDDDDETGSLIVEELEPSVFEIDDLEPGNATVGQGETVTLSATVENTGEAEGGRPVRITGTATTNTRRR